MAQEDKIKYIRPQEGFQELFVRSNVDVVFGGGVLNDQPIESHVITPFGVKTMGEVKVGDIVCDIHGGKQLVTMTIDKGFNECVEFTLDDGRKVESSLDHHWLVRERHGKILDVSAKEIMDYIDSRERYNNKHRNYYRIPNVSPVYFRDTYKKERTIHPYLLGCMLGDGWFSDREKYVGFCNPDEFIIDKMSSLGCNMTKTKDKSGICYRLRNDEFKPLLKEMNLWGKVSHTKFIPRCYKFAPIDVRMDIIRGLFDTDGYAIHSSSNRYVCGYRTVSKQLADDVKWIINSLGGKCYICTSNATIRLRKKGGDKTMNCRESYGFKVQMPNNKDLFYLPRKKDLAQDSKDRKVLPHLSIKSYKLIGKKHTKCIQVSGDEHLYLTNGCVMTRNCGKSFSAILSVAEPSLDPKFRACFTRRTFTELKSGGSLTDDFKVAYGDGNISLKTTDPPKVTFPSGAFVDFRQIADENPRKVKETWKGSQYDLIYMDELTSYEFSTFKYLLSRNRGKAKWSGKFRATTNPEKDCWIRTFIDWYVGVDGQIREDRNGVVRYFYIGGESVEDVTWGDSKEEVYEKCSEDINRKLKALGGGFNYKNLIKSFTFYLGKMSENKASIGNNMDYAGSVAAVGGREAQQLIEGNWNASTLHEDDQCITPSMAESVFRNDPRMNNDLWVTADLADSGDDNTVILVWNGLHIIDYLILCTSTPRENAQKLQYMADKHGVPDSHIVYDAIRATYINDYIEFAVPFMSSHKTMGKYGRMYRYLKDECYARLVEVIKRELISFEDYIPKKEYIHKNIKTPITIRQEFIEECLVVRFKEMPGGKKALLNKKEMNAHLGRGRSMDLLDPIAMRMMPLLDYEYGEELIQTEVKEAEEEYDINDCDIYDDTTWA